MPLRLVVGQGDPIMARLNSRGFPTLRVLNKDGAVVGEPKGRSTEAFVKAIDDGKKNDVAFDEDLKKADLKQGATRADFVKRRFKRGEPDKALELYGGFDEKDGSDERWGAAAEVVRFHTAMGNVAEAEAEVAKAEKLFGEKKAAELTGLRQEIEIAKINVAYKDKKKDECLRLLEAFAEKYPEHPMSKKKDDIKKKLEKDLK